MSRPTPPRAAAAQRQAAVSAAFAGAVDLSALAARAQQTAARPAAGTAPAPGAQGQEPGPAATPAAGEPQGPRSPYVVDVTEESFQQLVQASTQVLVVVDLWATWCEPCKQLSPVLEKLADEGNGSWILAKIDVDASPRIAQAFGVQSVPTVVALAAGQPVDAFTGVQPEPQLRQWISGLLDALRDKLPGIAAAEEAAGGPPPKPEDPRLTAAEDLMADGAFDEAAAAFQKILDAEPANADAARGHTAALFYGRVAAAPPDAVQRADDLKSDDPGWVAAQCAAADVQVSGGDVTGAFDRLVAAVRVAGPDERTALREHLVQLFGLFDPADLQVVAARRALAAALY